MNKRWVVKEARRASWDPGTEMGDEVEQVDRDQPVQALAAVLKTLPFPRKWWAATAFPVKNAF